MITARPYRATDAAACRQVFFRAVREGAADFYDEAQRLDWATEGEGGTGPDLTAKLAAQSVWVSEEDGRITGFMSLMDNGHLDMAYVLPEAMGSGHASVIYDALMAHARDKGLPRLTVHASEYSRRFLSRRGWQLDRVELLTRPSGVTFDRNHMSLAPGAAP